MNNRKPSPIEAIVAALRKAPPPQRRVTTRTDAGRKAAANYMGALEAVAMQRRVHALPPIDDAPDADAIAASIIAAGKTRDRGGPDLPKPDGEAALIIAAGKRRRGETP